MSVPPLAPLTDEALAPLFWRPERLGVDSAWYGHVPFAHWLVGAHRPASIVELGAHNGVSYAAFCEAVLRNRLDARAIAVDTWHGDEHAGFYGDEVYADLCRFHEQRYSGFSTLLRSTFDDALKFVLDGSVDLLHIDGRHLYEDVAHDFTTWLPKLSPRAVVLFHDTNVRERDFGVFRLWAELSAQYPHFEFLHGHGLGVLAHGPAVDGTVAALCGLADGGEINAIRERFALLGERWIATRDLRDQHKVLSAMDGEIRRLNGDMTSLRAWGETAQAEVNRLFPQLQSLQDAHRTLRGNLAQARYDVAARDLRLSEIEAARAHADAQARDATAALARANALIDALAGERVALLGSTSWRITRPVRRVIGKLRGQPAIEGVLALPASDHVTPCAVDAPFEAPAGPPMALANPAKSTRMLFISGEDHTPGTIYRVERYAETARSLGYEARAMSAGPVGPDDLAGVGLVVLWRVPYSAHIAGIITVAREQGATIIFDVDDLMFRPEFATIEIIDGIRSQRFSEAETASFFGQIAKTLRACDLVSCPTAELAHQARLVGRAAYVLPNGFDAASHAASRQARQEWLGYADDLVRIGYASGSRTHQRDFAEAAPAIARVLRENPQARLTVFRDGSSNEGLVLLDEFPAFASLESQIEWRDLVKLADLPKEIARFEINIAPLQANNIFCAAKSELKFFEAALCGVPTVASPSGPYARAIEDGRTGFLAADEAGWYTALSRLVGDAALRARMAQAAYHVSLASFGPEARAQAFSLMLAQIGGGAHGAAAFERARYRATLPMPRAPHVPEHDILFERDRLGAAQVSVIVPVFKYADYVTEALASVADQTLAPLDLIVIDDASPDDSAAMVLDWVVAHEARFNRLLVLRHKGNAGLGFARNSGFAAASTAFVLPLDADNRLRPQAAARLLAEIEAHAAGFAYPAIQQFGDKAEIFGSEAFSVLRLQRGNYIDAMALVRKTAWALAGGYDHIEYGWEDFDFWCKLAERGAFGVAVGDMLADYRVHGQSMLHLVTEKDGHRAALAAELMRRHGWLDLAT